MEGDVGLLDSVEIIEGALSFVNMRRVFLFKLHSNLSVEEGDCWGRLEQFTWRRNTTYILCIVNPLAHQVILRLSYRIRLWILKLQIRSI